MARRSYEQYIRYDTDGSAARKVQRVPSANKAELPKPRKQKHRVVAIDPVGVFGIVTAVCMLACLTVGCVRYQAARKQEQAMQAYVDRLSAENEALREQYEAGYDLEEIEEQALAMGLVPKEQVERSTIAVSVPVQEQTQNLWERITTFLAGLFA